MVLFCIGRPASGKSTVIKQFLTYCRKTHPSLKTLYIDEYQLLRDRTADIDEESIRWLPNGQFEIIDRTVFLELEKYWSERARSSTEYDIFVIEFSRTDYAGTFERFPSLLRGPFLIVYIKSSFKTCYRRNVERSRSNPVDSIPDSVLEKYYELDDISNLEKIFKNKLLIHDNETDLSVDTESQFKGLFRQILQTWEDGK